jgi:hypothetical protein
MKKHFLFISFFVSALIISFSSCKKEEVYSLYSSDTKINFDYDENVQTIGFSNIHDESIDWKISGSEDYFVFDKSIGTLGAREVQQIQISLDRSLITGDSISTKLTINSSAGDQINYEVNIRNLPEEKFRLDFRVGDAEYNDSKKMLYMTPYNSSSFNLAVYDVAESTIQKYSFDNNSYGSLAVSPNADKAIIYRYNSMILIDLNTMQELQHEGFNDEISDIVFVNSDIAYVFVSDYTYDFYQYKISTGEITAYDLGMSYGSSYDAILHPGGKYIYAMEDYYSSGDLAKIKVDTDVPALVYNEYMSGKEAPIWFNQDGDRLFFGTNHVAEVYPAAIDYDIISIEELNVQSGSLKCLAENTSNGHFYMSFYYNGYSGANTVKVFDSELNQTNQIVTEDFIYLYGSSYQYTDANVDEIFFSKSLNQLIVITKPESSIYSDGIEIIDL